MLKFLFTIDGFFLYREDSLMDIFINVVSIIVTTVSIILTIVDLIINSNNK